MPAHRKDEKAEAMHSLYNEGHSLAQVAKAFGVTRQCVFKMFAQRNIKMRTVQPLPFIVWEGRKYNKRPNGYFACTAGRRVALHRHIWEKAYGPIPKGFHVHHKDGNKEHNILDNLELLSASEHSRLHVQTNEAFRRTRFKPGCAGRHYPKRR